MYRDAETGYEIRKIDFNKREEVELYIQASDAVHKEILRGRGKITTPPLEWANAFCIGHAMRYDHLKRPNSDFWLILDKGNPIAISVSFAAVTDSPFGRDHPMYPIFVVCQFEAPFTDEIVEIYEAVARMFRAEGCDQVWCHTPVNHRISKKLPILRRIGRFPPEGHPLKGLYWDWWEMKV